MLRARTQPLSFDASATAPGPASGLFVPFGLAIAITGGLSLAAFGPAIGLIEPTDLPAPFPDQNQGAENFLFLFSVLVALPCGALAGTWLTRRLQGSANGEALPVLAWLLPCGLGGAVVATKLSERLPWGGGVATLSVLVGLWGLASIGLCAYLLSRPRSAAMARLAAVRGLGGLALAGTATLLALSLTDLRDVSVLVLGVGLVAVGLVAILATRYQAVLARPPGRRVGAAIDLGASLLLFAAALNLVIFTPADPSSAFETTIIQFHQNFMLGTANHVLAGDVMLVDSFSQYGVGSIYLLAGWFQIAPAGNGTLGLLDGGLSAAGFVAAYAVCRMSGVPRWLVIPALGMGVCILVYGLIYPLGALPQHGGIRFGLPFALLVSAVGESRWRDDRNLVRAARAVALVVVGLSSAWALEGFLYTTATLGGLLAAGALLQPSGGRTSWLRPRVLACLAAWALAHLLLATLTLVFSGALPDWARYFDILYAFLAGPVGDLTYDFSAFSAGFVLIAGYLASSLGLFAIWRHRPDLAAREPTTMLALAGTTAYGVALFSYLVNRSADHIVPYVSLPALVVLLLWLGLLRRTEGLVSPRSWRMGLVFAAGLGVLAVSVASSSFGTRVPQSALAHALPGGSSLTAALDRLWDPPPLDPRAPSGVRLLEREMPDEDRSLVLTSADLGIEVLVRSGRANVLPLADPWEDSFVPELNVGAVGEAVDDLEEGELMLVDQSALDVFDELRRAPSRDPIEGPIGSASIVPTGLADLQQFALGRIGQRFDFEPVAEQGGLFVVELVRR